MKGSEKPIYRCAMRKFLTVEKMLLFAALFILIAAASLILPAMAQDNKRLPGVMLNGAEIEMGDGVTNLIVDTENKRILILIDGEEIAVIDAKGLTVNGVLDAQDVVKAKRNE